MEVDFLEMGGAQAARWLYIARQKEACDEVKLELIYYARKMSIT
jgi:hypothetical protein